MLTTAAAPTVVREPGTTYPPYRPFVTRVQRVLRLSPHMVRVTFASEDLAVLGTCGLDQRVKLVVPHPDGTTADVGQDDPRALLDGTWYTRWRALPDEARNPIRTYTVRAARPSRGELDVDMVLHPPADGGPEGPASAWVRRAQPGDTVVVVGPDARTEDPTVGLDWRPGHATRVLLIGDETAAPAICSIVEQLPPHVTAQAFVEVPTGADILTVLRHRRSRVVWLARDAGCETAQGFQAVAPHGLLLTRAVRTWLSRHAHHLDGAVGPVPAAPEDVDVDRELLWEAPMDPATGDVYAWVAGEASMVRDVRRFLVGEVGLDRKAVAFMGYWRQGRAEGQ